MVFTLILWVFMFLVYFSSRNNKTNQWCAITFFIFSLGPFKEFLFYDLPALKLMTNGLQIPLSISREMYSVLTAILYYLVMPCSVVFALYFSELLINRSFWLQLIKISLFLPSVLLFLVFLPTKTSMYQNTSMTFWHTVTIYNFAFGILLTLVMVASVTTVKAPSQKQQNLFITLILLPPVWYWLITIFLVHSLQLTLLYKIWKDNVFILSISLLFYFALACTEGIMGLILRFDHYLWNSERRIASKEANYTDHMLKNELVKIEWSISNLRKIDAYKNTEELRILEHSASYIREFISKNQLYSGKIIINLQKCSASGIINMAIASFRDSGKHTAEFECHIETDFIIPADPLHLLEVFENLFHNAAESMKNSGKITIILDNRIRKNFCRITIRDEGCGIAKKNRSKIFTPYFSTKGSGMNYGLGLSYCYNVVKAHKGHIYIESEEGKGTAFFILLPVK